MKKEVNINIIGILYLIVLIVSNSYLTLVKILKSYLPIPNVFFFMWVRDFVSMKCHSTICQDFSSKIFKYYTSLQGASHILKITSDLSRDYLGL